MLKIKMTIGILNVNIFFSMMILFNYCYDNPSIYDLIVIMIKKTNNEYDNSRKRNV